VAQRAQRAAVGVQVLLRSFVVFSNTLMCLYFLFIFSFFYCCDGNSFLIIVLIPFEGVIKYIYQLPGGDLALRQSYYYILILDNNILVNYVLINKFWLNRKINFALVNINSILLFT
jgi:hypothetical protein